MFKPTSSKDRLNYGDILMPPAGFRFECAVGTTYSLDLETLTAVIMALGLVEDTDSELMNNPISMLTALQKSSDRIVVFCEAGQIKLPSRSTALCLMLEKMIVPISLSYDKRIKRYPAFHPKTWLIEYCNDTGDRKYKFIVMSRNMTFDHSWDIACSLDGELLTTNSTNAEPIRSFLLFLKGRLHKKTIYFDQQKNIIDSFLSVISNVQFSIEPGFTGFDILPLGIGKKGYDIATDRLFTENFHELVIMSPFLTGSEIEKFNNSSKTLTGTKRTLITRKSELPKIIGGEASNFDIYVMKDEIIDGESFESEGDGHQIDDEIYKQDIHAKIYIRRKNSDVDLYVGSMNASYAAINSNVEMMVRLSAKNGFLNGEKFLNDIMGEDRDGKMNPFVKATPESLEKNDEMSFRDKAEGLIKLCVRIRMSAEIIKNNDKFDVKVISEFEGIIEGVRIRPLRSKVKDIPLSPEMVFRSLEMLELSEFYVISSTVEDCTLERVIMIPTDIPIERDAEIIKSVIKTKKQFIDYVAFVLGDDYVQSFLESKKASGLSVEWNKVDILPAVYEKMLKIAVSNPERIGEIEQVVHAVEGKEIIPTEFKEMYHVFCDTLGINKV